MQKIELKGLSPEQVDRLLPEGLISLCWRGSVAHGMYVPKSDPDSIDDKDVMGVYIGPLEHYLGFGRRDVYEQWEGEWGLRILRAAQVHRPAAGTSNVLTHLSYWTSNAGAWPLEKVKAEAERLFQLSQEAYVRSSLPPEPDRDRAERLCVEMISTYHNLS